MSIKVKTSVTILLTAILLCLAVYVISKAILLGNVLNQEKENTKQYLERINTALEYKSSSLNATINDWSDWDDTYRFVQDRNSKYIESNLNVSSLMNLRLNLIMYIDVNGKVVWGKMLDLKHQSMTNVNQSILQKFQENSLTVNRLSKGKKNSGLLAFPEGIMMLSIKSILRSDSSGPAKGVLVFGRFIDRAEKNEIQQLTGVPFSIEGFESPKLPVKFEDPSALLVNGEQYYIHSIIANSIVGYSRIKDIFSNEDLLLKVTTDRKFYQQSAKNTYFYIIALLICGIVILGISIIILQKSVISRLLELDAFMKKIRSKHDISLRMRISGNDEITDLADGMNRMLEELNNYNEENQRLLTEVMKYDELKSEFFSNISHEFRTPINVLLSTLQLMKLQQENPELGLDSSKITRYSQVMTQNCYRLLRLANNLIDITKMSSGFLEMNLRNCNVIEVIEEITLSVVDYIQGKGISLQFDTDTEEKIIAIDVDKIERIILNLLSNAVKFTDEQGAIYVTIKDLGESIEVSVKDTGIGIEEDKLAIIFERFRQVNDLLTRSHEGSGIGLSLVKSLVELHGGSISVESEYGVGTEFIFTLPAKVCEEEPDLRLAPMLSHDKVERINIEFADVYNLER